MSVVAPVDSNRTARSPVISPRCPWYVAAVMVVHLAIGAALLSSCAILVLGTILSLLFEDWDEGPVLAVLCIVGGVLLGLAGVMMLYSGNCIRLRKRRRYSVLCAALLCFGGPMARVGLLGIYALTRPRALEYYEAVVEAPAFAVLPARR